MRVSLQQQTLCIVYGQTIFFKLASFSDEEQQYPQQQGQLAF